MVKKLLYLALLCHLLMIGCSNNNRMDDGLIDGSNNKKLPIKVVTSEEKSHNSNNVVTFAEINSLSFDSIENFELPADAVLLSQLDIRDSLYYMDETLFTGTAYSLFENRQLGQFKTIKDGKLSGPAYAWYENGAYAMEANFLDGYLAGRFMAWSEVGDLIYDIYFDKGQFQSDLQYERDSAREEQEMDSTEGDGDSEGNGGE